MPRHATRTSPPPLYARALARSLEGFADIFLALPAAVAALGGLRLQTRAFLIFVWPGWGAFFGDARSMMVQLRSWGIFEFELWGFWLGE